MSSLSEKERLFLFIASILISFTGCGAKDYCSSNICRNTKQHTLCKFPSKEPAKRCFDFEKTLKSEEDRDTILDKLNNRRNKVAAGEIRSLPASADMMKLEWNTELELFAQRWANQCIRYSSPDLRDTCRDLDDMFVGQNIASIYGDSPGLTAAALVDVWYMELLSINESILSRFRGSRESGFNHYEYFSQLVWAESEEVGCGSVKYNDRDNNNRTVYRLVCNFAPGGNSLGQSVYTYGIPCSRCPQGTACDPVFKALCGRISKQISIENATEDESLALEFETSKGISSVELLNIETTTQAMELRDSTETGDDNFTPYDFFSHSHDFTRQLVTATATKHDCKDIISVDNIINLLRKRLSSDPALKELLFSSKFPTLTGFIDSSFTDPSVAAFVSKLYSKKESPTTIKITESDLLNSTLLVDLVEAVIFRSNGGNDKMQFTEEVEHTTPYVSEVSPVKIQAELARIQQNSDFTGHYFFPEDDDEEASGETTEVYYDTSNIQIKDVMLEIEEIKKSTVTVDFLDEIFEAEPITESSTLVSQLSPDDMNVYKSGYNVMKKFLEDITDKTPTQLAV